MSNEIISPNKNFEDAKKLDENGIEYWMARELMPLFGYTKWENFEEVIGKAARACMNSGQAVDNHFANVRKMVEIGSNAVKEIHDWKLDRYACYLIAQNGDSRKSEIAIAQTYFAIQTRRQEIFEQLAESEKRLFIRNEVSGENKKLFGTAKRAGVSKFGLFNDAGYKGLYGLPLMVGGKIRQTIKDIGGMLPENLHPEKHIKEVKKEIKKLSQTKIKKLK